MIRDVQALVHRELSADTAADPSAPAEDPFFVMLHATVENTQRALGHLSPDTIAQAVALLQDAGSIAVVGDGLSASLAEYLALSLRMVGRPAAHLPGDALSLALWLNQMPPDALLVAVSLSAVEGPGVPNALRQAQGRGAATLALAASPLSPCAQSAALALTCLAGGESPTSPCLAAMASLVEALTATMAAASPGAAANGPLWQHARDLLQPPRR
jgi:DNA-binding MurR/RpiR family transcriptional regulator